MDDKFSRAGYLAFGVAVTLLGLRIYEYGYIDLTDFIVHEWYGLILLVVSLLLVAKKKPAIAPKGFYASIVHSLMMARGVALDAHDEVNRHSQLLWLTIAVYHKV